MNGMLCTFSAQMLHKSSTAPSITPIQAEGPAQHDKDKAQDRDGAVQEGSRTKAHGRQGHDDDHRRANDTGPHRAFADDEVPPRC